MKLVFQPILALAAIVVALSGCGGSSSTSRPPTAAQKLNAEGVRRLERGDLDDAEQTSREALRESELVDDLLGQAEAWSNLGAIATARGASREAWACHTAALRLHIETGTRDEGEVRARTNLGGAMLASGEVAGARAQFEEARKLGVSLNAPKATLLADIGLLAIELSQGNFAAAVTGADNAIARARAADDDGSEAAALALQGAAYEGAKNPDGAKKSFDAALAIDRKREQPVAVGADLIALARLAEQSGHAADASSLYARASRVERRLGELALAERLLSKALSLATSAGSREAASLQAELDALHSAHK